jgi:hypothetical protein
MDARMPRYIFRLATADDLSDIRRLQAQFIAEMHDPLGVVEEGYGRSEFTLLEAVDERGARVVGMTGLMRASSSPFVFERVFPEVWERIDLQVLSGRAGLTRDELVENDWGYVEKEHRRRHLAVALWAGCMLVAHQRGYPVLVGIGNQSAMAAMGDAFRTVGLAADLAGVRYELGLLFPAESAPRMADIVREVRARDPDIVWRLSGLEG